MSDTTSESPWSDSALEKLPREGLVALWTRTFGSAPPPNMSRVFLRRFLAFELQARTRGPLPKSVTAGLARLARQGPRRPDPKLRPGGRYLREWNGVTHVVDVTEGGYLWNGETHASLSAIARAITGARWSGPRFFGAHQRGPAGDRSRGGPA